MPNYKGICRDEVLSIAKQIASTAPRGYQLRESYFNEAARCLAIRHASLLAKKVVGEVIRGENTWEGEICDTCKALKTLDFPQSARRIYAAEMGRKLALEVCIDRVAHTIAKRVKYRCTIQTPAQGADINLHDQG